MFASVEKIQTNRVGEELMNICNVLQRVFVRADGGGGGGGRGGTGRETERQGESERQKERRGVTLVSLSRAHTYLRFSMWPSGDCFFEGRDTQLLFFPAVISSWVSTWLLSVCHPFYLCACSSTCLSTKLTKGERN